MGGLDTAAFDGLLLPGGHAPGTRQYLGSPSLREQVARFWALGRPVGAICHGVLVLARTRDPATGRSVLSGCRTTCLPRFYPALLRAGIADHLIDASAGMSAVDRAHLLDQGIGITSLVARATASADELGPAELIEGARALAERVRRFRPRVVAILGVTAYRTAFQSPRASLGRQSADLGDSQLWVVPNPSGRNAHASLDGLAAAYREVALAAGVPIRSKEPS